MNACQPHHPVALLACQDGRQLRIRGRTREGCQEQCPDDLGVSRSLSGKLWLERGGDERLALAIAQRWQVPELIGRLLAARGQTLDSVEGFLNPRLRDSLPDRCDDDGGVLL